MLFFTKTAFYYVWIFIHFFFVFVFYLSAREILRAVRHVSVEISRPHIFCSSFSLASLYNRFVFDMFLLYTK